MAATNTKVKRRGLRELKGTVIGHLTVLGKVPTPSNQRQRWSCQCVCGKLLTVGHDALIHTNHPKTHCGCQNAGPSTIHREEYHIWRAMLQRCRSDKHASYKDYGGRGIQVCERWNEFENFLADMGKRPSKLYSIDRINPDGNYEPGNVQWATDKHQARNKRKSLYLPHPTTGEKTPAAEVAEILGLTYQQLRYRYMKLNLWPTQIKTDPEE